MKSMIVNPADYRIGDLVLFDGAGPAFTILSWLLGRFDPAWRRLKRKPWHVAFISLIDIDGTVYVSEAKGGVGITETELNSFKNPYLVFRWLDTPPGEKEVFNFIADYYQEPYDNFWGYLFVILWYFWRRWPFIIDYKWMCWEWVWFFCLRFGKPVDNIHKYPLITLLMDKVGYPGY